MSQFSDNYLLIDIGNSNIKWITEGKNYTSLLDDFSIDMLPNAEKIWVSCVANCEILDGLKNINFAKTDYQFDSLKCGYKDPSELGVDRYLAIIAAMNCYMNQDLLVIDIGSAITFDVVLSSGHHSGGLIMPGMESIRSSFSKFSTNNIDIHTKDLTHNTTDAWLSGTSAMLLNSINLQIDNYKRLYKDITVVVTGGGAKKVLEYIKIDTKYHNNLVLDGLRIYAETINNTH